MKNTARCEHMTSEVICLHSLKANHSMDCTEGGNNRQASDPISYRSSWIYAHGRRGEVCMANVGDRSSSEFGRLPSWERERCSSYVVMMEVKADLIHIKQSLCPYMGIRMSQTSAVILFQSLDELHDCFSLFQPRIPIFIF